MRRRFALPLLTAALISVALVPTLGGAASGQEAAAELSDPARGEKLFGQKGCNGCHSVEGIGGQVGPELTGVFNLDLTEDRPAQEQPNVQGYVRESIQDPQADIVPGFPEPSPMPSAETFGLSEQDIDDLIAYLGGAAAAEAN